MATTDLNSLNKYPEFRTNNGINFVSILWSHIFFEKILMRAYFQNISKSKATPCDIYQIMVKA